MLQFSKQNFSIKMDIERIELMVKCALLRSSSDDRILWIRSEIEIKWLIEHVANGGQLLR